ncbi:MAG: efflux RND transporter periplasmic adaptor subunit [Candidatus Thiodiazotropha sp. (ex Monitilora ramsayi)]|nr:efflux RND transporter periplasmic adaptor subunit [Candidatus Thiodiazotropha sp. (ex Monitilora ramsayi)]
MNITDSDITSLLRLMFVGLCFTLLVGCSEEPNQKETKLRPVKYVTMHSGTAAIRDRVFSGITHAAQEADLSFKVSGTVNQVAVVVGDRVHSGDLIAELDSETYRVELEQARASLAKADATRRNAEAEYQRVRQLYTNDNASQNELDSALANAESAKAAYNADAQNVRLAKLNLQYTRLTVDTDCSVADISIEPNENVTAGATVVQVNCGEGWEVKIAVPESLIGVFRTGSHGSVQFAALRGETFSGVVTEIGTAADSSTTFPVTLSLNNTPSIIRSGLAAEVTFQFTNQNASSNRFYLTPAVVGQDESGTFVYVMEASDSPGIAILRRRSVEVGEISELGLEILNGLSDGERVIVAGHKSARDGLVVRDE